MRTRLTILLILFFTTGYAQVSVTKLLCEMSSNPMGIDTKEPRFSWQINSQERNVQQTTYTILVSSTEQKLKNNDGDIWNSGEIKDSKSILIPFKGKTLTPATKYFWKVIVITNKGSVFSAIPASFSTGLFSESDWKAKWIGYDKASPWDSITQWSRLSARYFRNEFKTVRSISRATVFMAGLGLYELFINGKRVGDQVLSPNPTDYRKSVFYNTHDVSSLLRNGSNAIGVVLGNGRFFTMRQNYKTQKHNTFGYPKMRFQLLIEYSDGSSEVISSNDQWKLNVDGPIRTNNEYDGEEYDATKEFLNWTLPGFNDKNWIKPEYVSAPAGELRAQNSPSMKVKMQIKPKSIRDIGGGKYILDMGQNFAGWLSMSVKGKKGQQVKLRFAESLQKNGNLFTANLRDAKVTDIYTLKGKGIENWHPSFVYHGFRYVEITGYPGIPSINNFSGQLIYDDLETSGSFQTSNHTINSIYKNAWWGIASNYKGMPVDCPQRNERQPWLGDRVAGAQGESFVFNNGKLYAKWMDDIAESQTPEGSIPDVAPAFWNYYSDNVTWPAAFITISNNLYNQFGDARPIFSHYDEMKKWVQYMQRKYLVNHIMTRDKYGDWCVPPESLQLIHAKDSNRITDGKLLATAYYYKLLFYMQRFANLTGNHTDASHFSDLGDSIRLAFQSKFYNAEKKYYGNNTVTANLLPLYFGICPDELKPAVFENIYKKIHEENNDHISTGLIGTQYLMRGLTDFHQEDLAFKIASNTTYPSWGYMVKNGATTIWELWNGNTADPNMNSQNHVMLLGDLLTWFYENLGGIRTDKNDIAFKKIIMKPSFPSELDFVKASYDSPYGTISSEWSRKKNILHWHISIPANSSARLYIPSLSSASIKENGKAISGNKDIKIISSKDGIFQLEVNSGTYHFSSTLK